MPTLAHTWRLNHALRDAQSVCALTKFRTLRKQPAMNQTYSTKYSILKNRKMADGKMT